MNCAFFKRLSHQCGVLTALPLHSKIEVTEVRAVEWPAAPCRHLENHATAISLNMHIDTMISPSRMVFARRARERMVETLRLRVGFY